MRQPTALLLLLPLACAVLAPEPWAAEPPAPADARLRRLARETGEVEPVLRIGLEDGPRVSIRGDGPLRVIDPATGADVGQPAYRGELHVVVEGAPAEGVASVFRVQVGAFTERGAAERELARLAALVGTAGVVHHDPDRDTWRVRLGHEADRLALAPLVEQLRAAGVEGGWISEEPARAPGGIRLRLVDAAFDSLPLDVDRIVVVPAPRGRVIVADVAYRGIVELRRGAFGTVQPINWVGLEHYLLGVVPAELGPEVWPQRAALAAQAVAARTYAWGHRGQFAAEGFDLCASPRCQVYGGASAEHPLSDRAVAETAGEILVFEGRPISALYTATCGGHTESGGAIFTDQDAPYLQGVPCHAEGEALASLSGTLEGRPIEALRDETGADVTRDWTLLETVGIVDAALDPRAGAGEAPAPADLRRWTTALASLSGRPAPAGPARPVASLGQAAAALLADLGWAERAEVLLATEDLAALLRDPATADLEPTERRALAYLAWAEGLAPFAEGGFRPERPPSRARLARAVVRIGESYAAFGLREAVVAGVRTGGLRLVQGKAELRLALAPGAALFGLAGGKSVPAPRLELWPGDRVRFRTSAGGAIDFLELQPPVKGAADDRTARVYSWEVRQTRAEIEAAINRQVAIGRLLALEPLRRGVSGRVVELRVVGSRGSTVVRGFDVRRLLDLRESLLVIEPQRDAAGEIEAVVFAGKGWGHGVGLCQVGAYGMALRGAGYREILAHYYRGAQLERTAVAAP